MCAKGTTHANACNIKYFFTSIFYLLCIWFGKLMLSLIILYLNLQNITVSVLFIKMNPCGLTDYLSLAGRSLKKTVLMADLYFISTVGHLVCYVCLLPTCFV